MSTELNLSRKVGERIESSFRGITSERLRWYGDGMLTSAAGVVTYVGSNIHTDAEFAKTQGFDIPIADGMLATNWISSMLVREFGQAFFTTGQLRTKYIKPTYVGEQVRAIIQIRDRTATSETVRYEMDVWTEDSRGLKLTDGEATVELLAT